MQKKNSDQTYRIASFLRLNILEGNREVDEIQIDISKTPRLILGLGKGKGMFFCMVVIPKLRGDKDILTFHKSFLDSALDTLACFPFVLVIVCSVEESVSRLDGLYCCQYSLMVNNHEFSRCRRYQLLGRREPSRGQSQPRAFHSQMRA